jgi:hypothetical protein
MCTDTDGGDGVLDPLGGRLWTPDEVATHFQVDKETLRRMRRERRGPPVVMLGRSTRRYPENGLIIWKRENAELFEQGRLAS